MQILRRRIWVLVGSAAIVMSLVLLIVFQLTPLFTATAEVLIDPRERNVADLEAVLSGLSPESSTIESQVEVIRSRSLATRVVEKLELDRDPEFNKALRERGALARAADWVRGLVPPGQIESLHVRRQRERARVVDAFLKALEVSRMGRLSFVISISFTSEVAQKATRVANEVAELYLVEQLEAKFEATRRAADWLNDRLASLRKQVRNSERAVEIYRAEHDLVDSRGITISEQQLSDLNGQLILARADQAETEARFRRVSQMIRSGGGVESVAEVLASKVVGDLRKQQAQLARKQAELASRYGERHPRIINVWAEQKDLERELKAEVTRIVANLENEAAVAQSRSLSLENSLAELQAEALHREQARIQLRELEREAAANRALYESFLGRFKETREQDDIQQADARIISSATPPADPSYPNKALFAGFGLLASVLAGLGAIALLERLDNCFRTSPQLESELQLPHLASVPELSSRDAVVEGGTLSPSDYTLAKPLSAYGEALRSLRTALLLSNVDAPPKVIVFTSSLPAEGKTTMAVSMGRAAAQSGMRTVVIDSDLRNPALGKMLGHSPEAGLVEYLAGQVRLEDIMLLDEPSGMYVLPVATSAANPPDLLGSESMRGLLEKLKGEFDLVLLDSAPVLIVADTRVLGRVADKVVFIVRWEGTPRDAARSAVHMLRQFGADIAGVVFSRLDPKRQSRYGYGGSRYYYGGYSGYNAE